VSLRPLNNGFPDAEGYISYELRYDITQELNPPRRNQVLTAARFVSNAKLAEAVGIRVYGADNNRTISR
ncbi:MAG: hypothetical protein AAF198_09680, partial [Pseudomonadota bacterium]